MLASYYAKYLFGDSALRHLPDHSTGEGPRFVFNATRRSDEAEREGFEPSTSGLPPVTP
jgi:hypothetical protein